MRRRLQWIWAQNLFTNVWTRTFDGLYMSESKLGEKCKFAFSARSGSFKDQITLSIWQFLASKWTKTKLEHDLTLITELRVVVVLSKQAKRHWAKTLYIESRLPITKNRYMEKINKKCYSLWEVSIGNYNRNCSIEFHPLHHRITKYRV